MNNLNNTYLNTDVYFLSFYLYFLFVVYLESAIYWFTFFFYFSFFMFVLFFDFSIFFLLEKALFSKTFSFYIFLLLFVLHINQFSLILLCHFFQKIKIRQNILEKDCVELVFPLSCFLLQSLNHIHYIVSQKIEKIKNLLLHELSTA